MRSPRYVQFASDTLHPENTCKSAASCHQTSLQQNKPSFTDPVEIRYHYFREPEYSMPLVLLTNVAQYAGPGALAALLADGHTVVCHDRSFVDYDERTHYANQNLKAHVLGGQTAEAIY